MNLIKELIIYTSFNMIIVIYNLINEIIGVSMKKLFNLHIVRVYLNNK